MSQEKESEDMKRGVYYRNKIFVGGLPKKVIAITLKDYFEKYGEVLEAKVVVDEAGRSRRYGFVTFQREESANVCLTQTNRIHGKVVVVGPAVKVKMSYPPKSPIAPVLDKQYLGPGHKYRYKFREVPLPTLNPVQTTTVCPGGICSPAQLSPHTPPFSPLSPSPCWMPQPMGENVFTFPSSQHVLPVYEGACVDAMGNVFY